jgi:DUF4097 and DUF4098 domain-containing protein YvlB
MNNNHKHSSLFHTLLQAAIAIILCGPGVVAAQTGNDHVTVNLTDPARPATLRVHLLAGSITVKGGAGKDVVVDAKVRGHEPQRTENGMKRIPMNVTGLTVEEENNQVDVKSEMIQRTVDLIITVPRRTSVSAKTVNDGDIAVSDVEGEIDVSDVNGSVTITNVAGSAVAHSVNGRVLATFTRIDPKPMAFSSLNGDIDVTFPPDLKASVSFQSDQGEVLSDFDVQLQATPPKPITDESRGNGKVYRVRTEKSVHGTINGGGPEMQFKTFNGNIYVRKTGSK